MPIRGFHAPRALHLALRGLLLAVLVAGLVAGPALAGKGGGKGGGGKPGAGTGGLAVVLVRDGNGNGAANWSDWITFSFTASVYRPQVDLTCSQNGSIVYGSNHLLYQPNFFDDDGVFWLSSGAWSGGAASCTAVLKGNTSSGGLATHGTLAFTVGG